MRVLCLLGRRFEGRQRIFRFRASSSKKAFTSHSPTVALSSHSGISSALKLTATSSAEMTSRPLQPFCWQRATAMSVGLNPSVRLGRRFVCALEVLGFSTEFFAWSAQSFCADKGLSTSNSNSNSNLLPIYFQFLSRPWRAAARLARAAGTLQACSEHTRCLQGTFSTLPPVDQDRVIRALHTVSSSSPAVGALASLNLSSTPTSCHPAPM